MLLERLTAYCANLFLSSYIKDVHNRQIQVDAVAGHVHLKNVELSEDALAFLDLPLTVKRGFVARVEVKFPWLHIRKKGRLKVELDSLFIVALVKEQWTEKDEIRRRLIAKRELLRACDIAADLRRRIRTGNTQLEGVFGLLKIDEWIEEMVDRLQVDIKNVHIRFEDEKIIPTKPFSSGFVLHSMTVQSTDQSFESRKVPPQVGRKVVYKALRIKGFGIYLNTDTTLSESFLEGKGILPVPQQVPESGWVLSPLDVSVFFTVAKGVDISALEQPKITAFMNCEEVLITIHQWQYATVTEAIARLNNFESWMRSVAVRKIPPFRRVLAEVENAKKAGKPWWKKMRMSGQPHVADLRSHLSHLSRSGILSPHPHFMGLTRNIENETVNSRTKEDKSDRRVYLQLRKQMLRIWFLRQVEFDGEVRIRMMELEDKMEFEDLLVLRTMAEREFEEEYPGIFDEDASDESDDDPGLLARGIEAIERGAQFVGRGAQALGLKNVNVLHNVKGPLMRLGSSSMVGRRGDHRSRRRGKAPSRWISAITGVCNSEPPKQDGINVGHLRSLFVPVSEITSDSPKSEKEHVDFSQIGLSIGNIVVKLGDPSYATEPLKDPTVTICHISNVSACTRERAPGADFRFTASIGSCEVTDLSVAGESDISNAIMRRRNAPTVPNTPSSRRGWNERSHLQRATSFAAVNGSARHLGDMAGKSLPSDSPQDGQRAEPLLTIDATVHPGQRPRIIIGVRVTPLDLVIKESYLSMVTSFFFPFGNNSISGVSTTKTTTATDSCPSAESLHRIETEYAFLIEKWLNEKCSVGFNVQLDQMRFLFPCTVLPSAGAEGSRLQGAEALLVATIGHARMTSRDRSRNNSSSNNIAASVIVKPTMNTMTYPRTDSSVSMRSINGVGIQDGWTNDFVAPNKHFRRASESLMRKLSFPDVEEDTHEDERHASTTTGAAASESRHHHHHTRTKSIPENNELLDSDEIPGYTLRQTIAINVTSVNVKIYRKNESPDGGKRTSHHQ
mmetsp:Transcript_42623/g.69117  ORF Transcript_42623/g.69117 Transcript_42623/m.69117 type:complete len:1016 (-) Transcript_42623:377-3424(-)